MVSDIIHRSFSFDDSRARKWEVFLLLGGGAFGPRIKNKNPNAYDTSYVRPRCYNGRIYGIMAEGIIYADRS